MSKTISALLKCTGNSYNLLNKVCRSNKNIYQTTFRYLYAQTTLGVDGYLQSREKITQQFATMSDKFKMKMSEYVIDETNKNMIFTEDLKNMIHMVESNEEDLTLVINMMKKFNNQNKELRFGSFVFGPVVMRMFYHLNKPIEALQCFKNPDLEGFFDQLMSYQILLDLLYEHKQYQEVIDTFEMIKSRQIQGTKYPKNIVVLTMAACYKLNTEESLKYALGLWSELQDVGHQPMRRAVTFCAGLALNQNKPDAALEIISTSKNQSYITIRNIKVAALAGIGRVEDVIPILKSVLEMDTPNNVKHTFCKDVLDKVRKAIETLTSSEIKHEFKRIEKYLTEQGHITESSLDEQLCKEISSPAFISANRNLKSRTIQRNEYVGKRTGNYRVFNQRPGLQDMN